MSGEIEVDESYFLLRYVLQLQTEVALRSFVWRNLRAKKENFVLHLKETKFVYNTKNLGQNFYQNLLKLIRENPVKFN